MLLFEDVTIVVITIDRCRLYKRDPLSSLNYETLVDVRKTRDPPFTAYQKSFYQSINVKKKQILRVK